MHIIIRIVDIIRGNTVPPNESSGKIGLVLYTNTDTKYSIIEKTGLDIIPAITFKITSH